MKIVCIYHSIDLDGWMSAAIVKHWWQKAQGSYIQENNHITNPNTGEDSIDFIGYNYGQPIPDLSGYDKVIMVDISFPIDIMGNLYKNLSHNFLWIDHHISAITDMFKWQQANISDSKFIYGSRDTTYAACELTWKYFFPEEQMPEIVRLLGRYDCFGHKGTNEEQKVLEFQYGARQCISNYQEAYDKLIESFNDKLYNTGQYFDNALNQIYDKGKAIYQYLCTEAKQAYKNRFPLELYFSKESGLSPVRFVCINKERFNPINFGIDYHADNYDGCACFHFANGAWNFSLYNDNGKVDCSVIAKQFGGGGHKGAAGFLVTDINSIVRPEVNRF